MYVNKPKNAIIQCQIFIPWENNFICIKPLPNLQVTNKIANFAPLRVSSEAFSLHAVRNWLQPVADFFILPIYKYTISSKNE